MICAINFGSEENGLRFLPYAVGLRIKKIKKSFTTLLADIHCKLISVCLCTDVCMSVFAVIDPVLH